MVSRSVGRKVGVSMKVVRSVGRQVNKIDR